MLDKLNRWVTVKDAAKYLGVSDKTVRRYIKAGKLPAARLSSRLTRISMDDLDEFISRSMRTVEPQSQK